MHFLISDNVIMSSWEVSLEMEVKDWREWGVGFKVRILILFVVDCQLRWYSRPCLSGLGRSYKKNCKINGKQTEGQKAERYKIEKERIFRYESKDKPASAHTHTYTLSHLLTRAKSGGWQSDPSLHQSLTYVVSPRPSNRELWSNCS